MRKRKDTGTMQKKETGKNYRICSAKQIGEQTGLRKLTTPLCKINVWKIKSKQTRMQ